jgi:hypothetical protein
LGEKIAVYSRNRTKYLNKEHWENADLLNAEAGNTIVTPVL